MFKIAMYSFPVCDWLIYKLKPCYYSVKYVNWIFPKAFISGNKTFFTLFYNFICSVWIPCCATMIIQTIFWSGNNQFKFLTVKREIIVLILNLAKISFNRQKRIDILLSKQYASVLMMIPFIILVMGNG